MSEIKLFDIVRTPAGNIAVVDMVGVRGDVSLNFVRGIYLILIARMRGGKKTMSI